MIWTDDEATLERVSCLVRLELLLGGQLSTRPSPTVNSQLGPKIKSLPQGSLGLVGAARGVGEPGVDCAVGTTRQGLRARQKTRARGSQ